MINADDRHEITQESGAWSRKTLRPKIHPDKKEGDGPLCTTSGWATPPPHPTKPILYSMPPPHPTKPTLHNLGLGHASTSPHQTHSAQPRAGPGLHLTPPNPLYIPRLHLTPANPLCTIWGWARPSPHPTKPPLHSTPSPHPTKPTLYSTPPPHPTKPTLYNLGLCQAFTSPYQTFKDRNKAGHTDCG